MINFSFNYSSTLNELDTSSHSNAKNKINLITKYNKNVIYQGENELPEYREFPKVKNF